MFNMSKYYYNKELAVWDYAKLLITTKQLMLVFKDFPEEYHKYKSKIETAKKIRSATIEDRHLEVVYICGNSGSGKTTLAKYLSEKAGYDAFVSGSGEDFLDGYDKEECIILDDFRAGSLRFAEMLKMLDNHTNSSIKSRYFNKDISNCKILFITSIYEPQDLYKNVLKNDEGNINPEPAEQFYRRLKHHYYKISDEMVYEIKLNEDYKVQVFPMKVVFESLGIDLDKIDDNSQIPDLFKKAFDDYKEKKNKDN